MMHVRVVKAVPWDACTALNAKDIFPEANRTYPDTFLLVDGQKGACNYWKKAQLAKEALAKGIIIVNDEP